MVAPDDARKALERAVDNQRAQRLAAQETKRVNIPTVEEGVETAETDRES